MKAILKPLELPTMDQIITVRILRFLEKVALMPRSTYSRGLLRSHAKPTQTRVKRDAYEAVVRPCTKSRWLTGL
jgi:hypothetical protein